MKYTALLALAMFCVHSGNALSAAPASADQTPDQSYQETIKALPALKPITFKAAHETHQVLVFIDNQCVYCTNVVKNINTYTDAGLTMSFLTIAPGAIRDSVITDMARVWCATDKQKSLKNAMVGFLPDNDATPECENLIKAQSAFAIKNGVEVTPTMVVLDNPPQVFLGSLTPEAILARLPVTPHKS
ncbi:thioredoxin fold domain-containing protein [Cronobacter malonaticus]|uniref:thioredoxin fold domain-containing protein n=1 Tax=Cronobacter malonaticus TaxID=413503 RepID=UPI000518D56A|nr:thioredoxin fold domain-containing protein [Cronobacter malonaticus]EMA8638674.1 thioredoxin fold domain-containing protein [Cronobacter malonaticus]EMD9274527.1 thioredoxin fold domain-containing protein [Cronobacter malonaticus]KIU58222.1 thiol:disulfide interchange protein DsbC [Cronobacter malonaticus ENBT0334]